MRVVNLDRDPLQDIGEELGGLIEMLSADPGDGPMVEKMEQLQEMLKVQFSI